MEKINKEELVKAYQNGQSLNSIAHTFGTYATTVKRILEKNGIELRHDASTKGSLHVKGGEKLIEWAKSQGRLVSKAELAKILGRKRLSPSYFLKYPELGQYIQPVGQKDLQDYNEKLYEWLQKNNISYKPNDKSKLKVTVSALLLGDYSNIAIQIAIKPKCISKKKFEADLSEKLKRANKEGIVLFFLNEKHFENLDSVKSLLGEIAIKK